jgi:DNA-binding IclR family transcriptional regulator
MGRSAMPAAVLPETGECTPQKTSTVGQTLALLRLLAESTQPMGVNPISRELGFPPSSCFRILKQLTDEGFAQFNPVTKCYSLGSAAVMLGRRALDPANTYDMILPSLTRFVERTKTSVGFWRRIDRKRIILAGFLDSPNPMRIHMTVGQRLPLFSGAVGRAFAAELGLTEEELRDELADLRWQSPPDFEEYLASVREYRKLGYAIDAGHFVTGVTTAATVLKDAVGGRTLGISAIRIGEQIDEQEMRALGNELVELKREITFGFLGRR